MSSVAILPAKFDASKISAQPIRELPNKSKAVNLDYADRGRSWMLQTPITTLPYGMNVFDKDAKNPKYSVDLSFNGADSDAKVKSFHDFAVAFDDRMIELALANAQAWFKLSNPSREIISAFYVPMVKIPRDKEGRVKPYPPTCKISLKQKEGIFTTQFYDSDRNRYEGVPIEELLVRGAKVRCIIQCTGLWLAGGRFGAMWKAEQVCIESMPVRLRGFGFTNDEDEEQSSKPAPKRQAAPAAANKFTNLVDDDEEDSAVAAVMPPAKKNAPATTSVAAPADEDEDEDEEEDDEVVAPVPVPTKKPVAAAPKKAAPTAPKKAAPKA